MWKVLTDTEPPPTPATPEAYAEAGLPWSDYFAEELSLVEGSETLARLKSIVNAQGRTKIERFPEMTYMLPSMEGSPASSHRRRSCRRSSEELWS